MRFCILSHCGCDKILFSRPCTQQLKIQPGYYLRKLVLTHILREHQSLVLSEWLEMSAEISLLTNDFLVKQTEESWETWVAVKRQTRTLKYQYESPVRELKWPPPWGGGTYCLLFHAREVWYRIERSGVIRMGTIIHSVSGPMGLHVSHELRKLLRYMQEWGVLVNFSVGCINISNESICNGRTERNHNEFQRGKMDKREPCRVTREE